MRRLALTAALALPALLATAPRPADACAMRRVEPRVAPTEDHSALMARARAAEDAGAAGAALALYEQAMRSKAAAPQRAEASFAAARLHAQAGDRDRAMSRLNRALSLDPKHAAARLAYAEGLLETQPAEAHAQLARLPQERLEAGHERRRFHLARARSAPAGADVEADLAAAARAGAEPAALAALRAARAPSPLAAR